MADEIPPIDQPDEQELGSAENPGAGVQAESTPQNPQAIPADQMGSPNAVDDEVERMMLAELAKADSQNAEHTIVDPHGMPSVKQVEFDKFGRTAPSGNSKNIEILMDVRLPVSIELGRTEMTIHDILDLAAGSVVELTKLAGEPVDLLVNNKVIAKGEVVVVDENFGLRVTSLLSQEERIKSL